MTIVGVNVTLPNLLNSTLKSAIVLFRQVFWGLPRSRGGANAYDLSFFLFIVGFSACIMHIINTHSHTNHRPKTTNTDHHPDVDTKTNADYYDYTDE